MRQIKFRVWNGEQMVSPDYVDRAGYAHWYEDGIPNRSNKLMQFTGLLDKNEKEIYEGDIVRLTDGGDVSHHRIYFDDKSCRWLDERLEDGDSLTCYDEFAFVKDAKIIGNIYENPDLLK